ncbi:GPI transamidase component GPI16 [Verticillium dahliae VDG1]|nr:GPI transamidase component GPI16 [Verticillium dahliae VDG1]
MPDYVQAVPNCLAWLFRESGPEWREIWDYQFKWTADHRTAEEMRPMIYTYDKLGEAALNRLDEISPPERTGEKGDTPPPDAEEKAPRDLYALVRDNADTDEVLGQLWKEVTTVPEWVDWAQIERGQHVFLRYAGPAIFALAFQSLVGGMGSRRVVETLARTGGFGVNVTRRRLLETFQHVLQVTSSLPAIQPHGDGFASTIRVRLLHAAVRRRILALAAQKPEYYSLGALGAETAFEFQYVPVLDTMATEVGTLDEAMRRGRELGVGSHERRSLWTLSVAGVVVGCGSWAGWLCLRGGVRALMGLLR